MPKKQPQQILSQRILQAVLTDLHDRKGFDYWWDNIETSIQREAKKELQAKIESVLAKDQNGEPHDETALKAIRRIIREVYDLRVKFNLPSSVVEPLDLARESLRNAVVSAEFEEQNP